MKLEVARILAVRGLKGEVKIQLLSDFPRQRLAPGARFEELEIQRYSKLNNCHYLKFKGIDQRETAEDLIGRVLTLEADSQDRFQLKNSPELNDPNQFLVAELIGLKALDLQGLELGRIVDVNLVPAQNQLVLEKNPQIGDPKQPLAWIPLVEQLVPLIDLERAEVHLDLPEGLL